MLAWSRSLGSPVARFTSSLRRVVALSAVVLLVVLFVGGCGSSSGNSGPSFPTALFPQLQLDGVCVPRFAVSLPVFGPAGSIPRVDAGGHPNLTVTMKEIDQQILPQGSDACGVKLGPTRVWAYETKDTGTGAVLGPANFPAVTIVAQRGTATQVKYVNQLPSFKPSNPGGPGLVQGVLPFDQTIHWADPLQSGCGMVMPKAQRAQAAQSASVSDGDKQTDFSDSTHPGKGHMQLASYPMPSMPMSSAMPSAMAQSTSSDPCMLPYYGPVPATVHLHGGEIPAAFDGDPDSWFTPDGKKGSDYHTIGTPAPGQAIYEYTNLQEPGTLWFHDHALGITRLNVYAGLAGFYFLKDPSREPQGYPSGPYEIEMAVQDRSFDRNSQLYFPQQQVVTTHPFWSVLYEGDVATVNGAAFPYLNVEPRRYRFHILNGSNHRAYTFGFSGSNGPVSPPVYLVGSDDNYFDKPVPADPAGVPLSPGERTDLIIDFSKFAGQNIILTNSGDHTLVDLPQIMQFRVGKTLNTPTDTSCDPTNPDMSTGVCARKYPLVRLTDGNGHVAPGVKVDRVRQLTFYDYILPGPQGSGTAKDLKEYSNGTAWNGLDSPGIAFDFPNDGVSELPRQGSIEEWDIVFISTMSMANHPLHLHLSQFQVLNRQKIHIAPDKDDPSPGYQAAWNASYGKNHNVNLPTSCPTGKFCPDFGPPLDYLTLNGDGAIGGNPAFGPFVEKDPVTKMDKISPPLPGESGWKDTAVVNESEVLRILVRWTPSDVPITPNRSDAGMNFYDFDPTQGYYVWHCHVLNHEDNEMMRPYRVAP